MCWACHARSLLLVHFVLVMSLSAPARAATPTPATGYAGFQEKVISSETASSIAFSAVITKPELLSSLHKRSSMLGLTSLNIHESIELYTKSLPCRCTLAMAILASASVVIQTGPAQALIILSWCPISMALCLICGATT